MSTELSSLYLEKDQLDEAMEAAEEMINHSGIPRYFRIKCYCLIAASTADEYEADEYLERADSQWGNARGLIPNNGIRTLHIRVSWLLSYHVR